MSTTGVQVGVSDPQVLLLVGDGTTAPVSAGANDAYVQNNLEVGGTLYVDGNSAVTGDMTVSGRITADGITDTADELFQVGTGRVTLTPAPAPTPSSGRMSPYPIPRSN